MATTNSTIPLYTFAYQNGKWTAPFPQVDSASTLVLVFGASRYAKDVAPLEELRAAYADSHIVGCSTSGEIFGTSLVDDSLAVAIYQFKTSQIATAYAPVRSPADSYNAGDVLARQLEGVDLRAVLVISDGLKVNGSELVRGLNSVLANNVVVTGGLAGDGTAFGNTWIVKDGQPISGFVCAVGLYGKNLRIGHGSRGGWDVFGPERVVTKSTGNVLYEIDGAPALELYKQYLGERAAGLPSTALLFPLAMKLTRFSHDTLVRTVLAVNEDTQSMTFAGDIPEGAIVQLMRANFDRLVEAAGTSSQDALDIVHRLTKNPVLSIAVSCVGRRLVLGERTEDELEAAAETLNEGDVQIGFYSYGELSPFARGTNCDLHNQTMTITTISEV